jgi:hypothetical protein
MTENTINIIIGENFISFPEGSTSTFREIFVNSGIFDNVDSLKEYDPITNTFPIIDMNTDSPREGIGYILKMKPNGYTIPPIIYEGNPFPTEMNLEVFKSMVYNGWNLLGTDNNIIDVSSYCRCIDASTNMQTNKILPKKAYWIHSTECAQPTTNYELLVSLGVFGLFFYEYIIKDKIKSAGQH